ncbi:hypothetical protein Ancab_003122 [Ancistrocladus abbreviatus]
MELARKHWLLFLDKRSILSIRFFRSVSEVGGNGILRDSYDYTHLLEKCRGITELRVLHAQIITGGYGNNPYLAAKLMGNYMESGKPSMEDARKVFDHLLERDVFVWNMIIQGYAKSGPFEEVLNSFNEMCNAGITANKYTYTFVLKACGASKDVRNGQVIHGCVVKCGFDSNLFVSNALVAFYGKCQLMGLSRKMFEELPQRDVVSWNSMISSYVDNGYANEALMLLHAMLQDGTCVPDSTTLVSILPACARTSAIREGLWVHSYIVKSSMQLHAALGSGLMLMYANCGRLSTTKKIFYQISDRNIVVWSVMIRCYGMHGHADEALGMFAQLVENGLKPDGVIFLCLLSACSHAGKVAEGRKLFKQMDEYEVKKSDEHYACMVDLFSRSGLIDEAVEFVRTMPVEAGKDVYGALFGACRVHKHIEVAEEVAEKLFLLDSENAGRYITLAKMYEDAQRFEDAAWLRKLLREKKIRKPVGYSAVEVDYVLHTFGVEDESHPFKEQIFDTLEKLELVMEDQWTTIDPVAAVL